jgi:hypothetical protein
MYHRESSNKPQDLTRSFTRTSELYVLIGHESALPRVFLIVYAFLYVLPQGVLVSYCSVALCPLNPITPLFSLGTLWY